MHTFFEAEDFKIRRKNLIDHVRKSHPFTDGALVLIGAFEHDTYCFRQESSFLYFTGVQEPGAVLWLELNGHATMYLPNHGKLRSRWCATTLAVDNQILADAAGIDDVKHLGKPTAGYQFSPFFKFDEYEALLNEIEAVIVQQKKSIFTISPGNSGFYDQRLVLERIEKAIPSLSKSLINIAPEIARLRRVKSLKEMELLFKAVEITTMAHEAAAECIKPGVVEYQVQAAIEFIFRECGAQRPAFPTIVGSGINSTILHYTNNNKTLQSGELVVVDIGAEYNYYCADLTRTYPVGGSFSSRQEEIYDMVLETQRYIAEIAKPGMYLSNKEHEDRSLYHLAYAFLKELGYVHYFLHGIGHFLGLDVHDVGDYKEPLQEGDIITIEPGIYIPDEKLGVRIEDNYWIVKNGAVCLSEDLPKESQDIELFMKEESENMVDVPHYDGEFDA
jgi:Xaa-Pro aminopeptidase